MKIKWILIVGVLSILIVPILLLVRIEPIRVSQEKIYVSAEKFEASFTEGNLEPASDIPTMFNIGLRPTLKYKLRESSEGWVRPGIFSEQLSDQSNHSISLDADGEIDFIFYGREDNSWNVGSKITLDDFSTQDGYADWLEHVQEPFLFKMKENGEIFGFEFRANVTDEAKQKIEQWLKLYQAILPGKPLSGWKTQEVDSIGVYEAEYERHDSPQWSVKKTRGDYLSVNGNAQVSFELFREPSVIEAKYSKELGWFDRVFVKETTISKVNSQPYSQISSIVLFDFESYSVHQSLPKSLEGMRSLLITQVDNLRSPVLDSMANGISLDEAIKTYVEQLEKASSTTLPESFFIYYLQKYPETSFELIQFLNQEVSVVSQDTELFLWYALGKSNTVQSQKALVEAAQDKNMLESTRMRALTSLHEISGPIHEVWDGLDMLYQSDDTEISKMALLTMGSIAGATPSEMLQDEFIQQISLELQSAQKGDDIAVALNALYNARLESSQKLIEAYLDHSESEVRAFAYQTLINIASEDALNHAFQSLKGEEDDNVIAASVQASIHHRQLPIVNDWAVTILQERSNLPYSNDNSSTFQLVEMLGTNVDLFPSNEKLLRRLANETESTDLKKQIYRYISPV